ncbi:glycosyltransferase family 2 protein [Pedobacter boryungensis]|uniref:Glycosyltransferase n=1 Tax=Pedobacter boryungensis TaxID=869962 RepID=A0ABX2DD26_9SPHI|nr:glycosyltransferase [Pedobacter boryungensis]NQX31997.1 glycosyltransferase [Pedobacter boryungensis]
MEVISGLSYFTIFLTLIYVLVVGTFIRGWTRIILYKRNDKVAKTKVSILIAARNEEDKIGKTINDLLAQDYDKSLTEIIVIDDHSTDKTAQIIASYSDQGIKLIQLNEANALNSYKKKAIQTAIGEATGALIITTDADCRMGPNWLKTIVNYYETNNYKMISAPVAYFEEKSFFERIQTLEFSYLIGLGASTIGNNNPSTCNGANLAYERKAFFDVGGFKGIDDLASGDDELLLHKMAALYEGKIGFLKNKDAIVYTHAKPTLIEFIQQRKRWASKSTRYKDKLVIVLGISIWLFNLSIIINALLAIVFPAGESLWFLLFQLICKIGIELIFLNNVTNFFKRKQLLVLLPIMNILHIIYFVYIGIAGNFGKYNWKDRMVK